MESYKNFKLTGREKILKKENVPKDPYKKFQIKLSDYVY